MGNRPGTPNRAPPHRSSPSPAGRRAAKPSGDANPVPKLGAKENEKNKNAKTPDAGAGAKPEEI